MAAGDAAGGALAGAARRRGLPRHRRHRVGSTPTASSGSKAAPATSSTGAATRCFPTRSRRCCGSCPASSDVAVVGARRRSARRSAGRVRRRGDRSHGQRRRAAIGVPRAPRAVQGAGCVPPRRRAAAQRGRQGAAARLGGAQRRDRATTSRSSSSARGAVGWLEFDRPDVGNAMNARACSRSSSARGPSSTTIPTCASIVNTGRGESFQTGLDVARAQPRSRRAARAVARARSAPSCG